ncbi:unnamed protein product [Phyllotreta striolata]|uniref:U6 snRNA phosphodiesterase n=1 Tax=Phyllotreta striolata TaxID=444603 RepID=A0A9N9XUC1_PHYSR|nr:unnamed protein product [Phyllotreta striolata]
MLTNKGSLSLLSDYGDNSSDDDVPGPRVSTKRTHKDDDVNLSFKKRLPLPDSFLRDNVVNEEHIDEPSLHNGRIRSFAHERGNWATFVYIPLEQQDGVKDLVNEIIRCAPESINLKPVDDFHISLTKTVILRHHWINPFVDSVKLRTKYLNKFMILFNDLKIYCNEERTRTFIGLRIQTGYDSLKSLVDILDVCLGEFSLPAFYEDPSFHMSIVWCAGDLENELKEILPEFSNRFQELMDSYSQDNWYMYVSYLLCKSGNKHFKFGLI